MTSNDLAKLIRDNYPPGDAPGRLSANFITHSAALEMEVERRNHHLQQDSHKLDADRLAIAAGIETRDSKLGNHTRQHEARLKQGRAERKSRNAMSIMLAEQLALLNSLDNALNYLDQTGDVEGTIKDPAVKAAIKAWQDRTGRKFDPDHPDAKNILKEIIEDYRDEQALLTHSQLQSHNGLSAEENEKLVAEMMQRMAFSENKATPHDADVKIGEVAKRDADTDALMAQMLKPQPPTASSPEDELGVFMRAIEETKTLIDPMERLRVQKDLIDGLSKDSRMIASFDPALEEMFKPDYFDALEADQQEAQVSMAAVSPNMIG